MAGVAIDPYVLDTLPPDLVGHDRQPSAFLVYPYLWRHTFGHGAPDAQVSLQEITLGTGLSKRAVQDAIRLLARRHLLSVARSGITAIPVYTAVAHGRRVSETLRDVAPDLDVAAEVAWLDAMEERETRGLHPVPGAADLLPALPADRWAIVCSGSPPVARLRMRAAGVPEP